LRSIADVVGRYCSIDPPGRDERRKMGQIKKWFHDSWSCDGPALRLMKSLDDEDRAIDGTRQRNEKEELRRRGKSGA
jgi:hypothetical protein